MADEERDGVRRWATRIGSALATLLVVYVLSLGPAAKWWDRHAADGTLTDAQDESITRFFAPLDIISDNCTPFEYVLDWYVDLWLP